MDVWLVSLREDWSRQKSKSRSNGQVYLNNLEEAVPPNDDTVDD